MRVKLHPDVHLCEPERKPRFVTSKAPKQLRLFKMKSCQPASLAKRFKCKIDSYFWIYEFRNMDHFKQNFEELILISEITNSEIRITSTLSYFCQAARI